MKKNTIALTASMVVIIVTCSVFAQENTSTAEIVTTNENAS